MPADNNMTKIKGVVFDWGGVLIDNPVEDMFEYLSKKLNVNTKSLRLEFTKYQSEFSEGKVDEETIWKNVFAKLGIKKGYKPSLWGEAFRKSYKPREKVFEFAKELKKKGFKVGFLSSTELPAVKIFREKNYHFFDVTVFSCIEGYAKPERKVYEITLEKLGLKPGEVVFIDDVEENLVGARKVGMHAILFKNLNQVKEEFSKLI